MEAQIFADRGTRYWAFASIWGKPPETSAKGKKTVTEENLPDLAPALLHFDRIRDLAHQLDSRADTLKFLETYLHMLPGRKRAASSWNR